MTRLFHNPGSPFPLGTQKIEDGHLNFAIYAKDAKGLTLVLFPPDSDEPFDKIDFDPKANCTGQIWHIALKGLPRSFDYYYLIHDEPPWPLIDPYAKHLSGPTVWGKSPPFALDAGKALASHPKATYFEEASFDWEGDTPLRTPLSDLIIYEMHVRGFTMHPSSGTLHKGTFLGLIEKIPYLKELGVNAVELLPIHSFNENEFIHHLDLGLCNYWGYSSINYFSLMHRYATQKGQEVLEFKQMVKELHKAGIEVIIDVVFNHTAEGARHGPTLSFQGLAEDVYYLMTLDGLFLDYTGCGNTFNTNHPTCRQLILESLRYFVVELHVDGFRFDLASVLTRGRTGDPMALPPLIEAISADPVLSGTRLIAEAWDAAGLYQLGVFPQWGIWSEWNGQYRDSVRRFLKGTPGQVGYFATRLCGSSDLYLEYGSPQSSLNFICAHDGFTLRDLVSYNQKHNGANGEEGRDGANDNESWNCGVEGKTDNPDILKLRARQMRNFHLALMISQGVPMVLMGDEYGHTKGGNNNTWCHDNELNWFLWEELEKESGFFRYFSGLIAFRKRHPLLKHHHFLSNKDIVWHGLSPCHPDWSHESQFIAFTLKGHGAQKDLYLVFNAQNKAVSIHLPPGAWHRIVDTSLPSPDDFTPEDLAPLLKSGDYPLPPYSAALFRQ